MKTILKPISTFILLLLFVSCNNKSKTNKNLSKEEYINEKFQVFAEEFPGVSIYIIKNHKTFYSNSKGYSNLDNKIPVTENTKFNIYSTSKYIVGLAYLKLINDGKVSLDQKVTLIDSSLPETYSKITIQNLLNHTSGIRHYKGKKDWIGFANLKVEKPIEAMQYFINDPLEFIPGSKENYTTFGLVLASHLIEKITGESFENAINKLLPLTEKIELDYIDANKATPYIKSFWKFKEFPNLNARSKFGGGGFIASAKQLAEIGALTFNNKLGNLEEIKLLFKQQWPTEKNNGIAFATGSGIAKKSFGTPNVLYTTIGGGSPGGRSYLFTIADLNLSIAIAGNFEVDGEKAYQFTLDCAKRIVLGKND